jgi:hypothetical protein
MRIELVAVFTGVKGRNNRESGLETLTGLSHFVTGYPPVDATIHS